MVVIEPGELEEWIEAQPLERLPGVGPKTAVKLLEQYPDVEQLIENAESLKPPRASKSLTENAAPQLSKICSASAPASTCPLR